MGRATHLRAIAFANFGIVLLKRSTRFVRRLRRRFIVGRNLADDRMEQRRRKVLEMTQELVSGLGFKVALQAFEILHIVGDDDLGPHIHSYRCNVPVLGLVGIATVRC